MTIREVLELLPDLDEGLLGLLVEINEYHGITTLVSCAGHDVLDDSLELGPGVTPYPYVDLYFWNGEGMVEFFTATLALGKNANIMLEDMNPRSHSINVRANKALLDKVNERGKWVAYVALDKELPGIRDKMARDLLTILSQVKERGDDEWLEMNAEILAVLLTADGSE